MKAVPFPGQLLAELDIVVDFAVVYQPEHSILIRHRLETVIGKVNDGKSAVRQSYAAPDLCSYSIRPPVNNLL
jgi:hypothetical protein